MSLTDLTLRKITPQKARFEILDDNGLYLRVMPTGRKSWVYRYHFDNRPRRMTLGSYPALSLAEARKKHAEAALKVELGIDPGASLQEEKAKLKQAPTIAQFMTEYWERELCKKKSGNETKRILEKDVVSVWAGRKVADIKRRDIVLLLDDIELRAPIMRNRVHGAMTRFFNLAAERGIIDDSPCIRIRKITEKGRSRVLTDDEIKLLWKAIDTDNKKVDMYMGTKIALKLILLTGQRPGEVCGMTRKEIEGDLWNIPAERMKGGEPHSVPITNTMMVAIEEAQSVSGDSAYIFVSPRSPLYHFKKPEKAKPKDIDSPMTAHALSRAISRHWVDMGYTGEAARFRPHDLRRTVRTRLAEIGVSDVVSERVLGHKLQGVLGIYNRHSYDVEKRQALALWERRLFEILGLSESTSNVIPFEVQRG